MSCSCDIPRCVGYWERRVRMCDIGAGPENLGQRSWVVQARESSLPAAHPVSPWAPASLQCGACSHRQRKIFRQTLQCV